VTELGRIVQIAYAVDDVEAAAREFARRLGAGPFFLRHHIELAVASHRGGPATFDHSSAYGQWGAVQVELVRVHTAEPAALAAVVLGPGLHHVAWFVADIEAERSRLEALGWPEVLAAETAGGVRFAFHDARAELGHLVEIYEPAGRLLSFYAAVAAAATGWDGTDPVRLVS
jgi:catechol 2,3-dioxygenase-like lactoylglutathione lyase family enzyme